LLVHTFTAGPDVLKKYHWPEAGRVIDIATDILEQMRAAIIQRNQSRGATRDLP
jgi:hypothetical protein